MEFKKPKLKKHCIPKEKLLLPANNKKQIIGVFNGQFVTVHDLDSMIYLYEAGNFGKGSLSKGEPKYHIKKDDVPKIMLQYQFENQAKWNESSSNFCSQKFSEPIRNDYKASLESVSNFLKSSISDGIQNCWKFLKKEENFEALKKNIYGSSLEFTAEKLNIISSIRQSMHHVDMAMLKEIMSDFGYLLILDEPDYKDEVFISFVNDILNSRQIRKPNTSNLKSEVIVLSTSFNPQATDSSPVDSYARLERLPFAPEETLNLNLEESFYLKFVLGCLSIVDLNLSEIGIHDLWDKFNSVDKNFTERYLTYNYYRSKGWVVRSGLKFGGDYLLYKDGPAFYHGSYLVKVLDGRKKLTWREFVAMNRLVETFNKDLVLINVFPNKTSNEESFQDVLAKRSVQEVLVRRWFPTKDRFWKESETSS